MFTDKDKIHVMMPATMARAVMFMNTNKSEENIRKMINGNRLKCGQAGILLDDEAYVVCKGPDRDIDRDGINLLISLLLTGRYDTVVVERMTDLTTDRSDLVEFMKDAAGIGVGFFVLSTMRFHMYGMGGMETGGSPCGLPNGFHLEVTV